MKALFRDSLDGHVPITPEKRFLSSPRASVFVSAPLYFAGAFIYLAFFLLLFVMPYRVTDATHEPGGQALDEYLYCQHAQWGTEVAYNVGPLGFLHFADGYSGIMYRQKLAFQAVFAAILALLVFAALPLLPSLPVQCVWLASAFLGLTSEADLCSTEVFPYLTLLLAAFLLFLGRPGRWRSMAEILFPFGMAFLALMKGTNLFLSIFLIAALCFQAILNRQRRKALLYPLLFFASLTGLWRLAHQNLANLPQFLLRSASFTSGYSEGMALYGPAYMTLIGACISVALAVPSVYRLAHLNAYRNTIGLDLFILFCTFTIWKHGFVRADIHMIFFLDYALASSVLIFLAREERHLILPRNQSAPREPSPAFGVARVVLWGMVIALCGIGYHMKFERSPLTKLHMAASMISQTAINLTHYPRFIHGLEEALEASRRECALPDLKRIAGASPTDYLGCRPGAVILTGFNYRSKPMPETIGALSKSLLERNAAYYEDNPRAPTFVVIQTSTFDQRLLPLDDSLAKLEVLMRYRPVAEEKDSLLVARAPAIGRLEMTPTGPATCYSFGQDVPVPEIDDAMVWVTIDVEYTWIGKLRSLLYKPPPLFIAVTGNQRPWSQARFIPTLGRAGCLINPLIMNNDDWSRVYDRDGRKTFTENRIRFFKLLYAVPMDSLYVRDSFSVSFARIPWPAAAAGISVER